MTRKQQAPQRPSSALLDRDGFIDSDELAAYLKVPVSTLDVWASRGAGPVFVKIGKYRRYAPADVRAWLDDQPRGNVPPAA